jgi:hypothetical protein
VKAETAQKMKGNYRTLEARQSLNVLEEFKKLNPERYRASAQMREAEAFLRNNIENIENGRLLALLRQTGQPQYRRLKSGKAILADLIFAARNR